jgi:hypothetical protein
MAIYFHGGVVLFDSGAVAMHEDCCCGGYVTCGGCNPAPETMVVTITGITCSDCPSAINGTHNLSWNAVLSEYWNACFWGAEVIPCDWYDNELIVLVRIVGSELWVECYISHWSYGQIDFRKIYAAPEEPFDCTNIGSIPYIGENHAFCSASSPTCVLSS